MFFFLLSGLIHAKKTKRMSCELSLLGTMAATHMDLRAGGSGATSPAQCMRVIHCVIKDSRVIVLLVIEHTVHRELLMIRTWCVMDVLE